MHGLRVLATGAKALAGDGFPVDVGPHRDLLRSVRRGERSVEEVDALLAEWRSGLDMALRHSPLPAEPDAAAADAFLIHARRLAAKSEGLLVKREIFRRTSVAEPCPSGMIKTRGRPRHPMTRGWSSQVAREAHNLEVAGSNPVPAISVRSDAGNGSRTSVRGRLFSLL